MDRKRIASAILWSVILVFSCPAWAAPTYKILHAFGTPPDGAGTWGSVILDKAGNVYGTTSGGGTYRYGTVFELTPMQNGMWSETILTQTSEGIGSPSWDTVGNDYNVLGQVVRSTLPFVSTRLAVMHAIARY